MQNTLLKDIHHRQKLTTDFFQTFLVDYFGCEYLSFEKKNMLTVVSRGSFLRGLITKSLALSIFKGRFIRSTFSVIKLSN